LGLSCWPAQKLRRRPAPVFITADCPLLRVTEDADVGVIGVGDDGSMRTAPLAVVNGAVVVSVTGLSTR